MVKKAISRIAHEKGSTLLIFELFEKIEKNPLTYKLPSKQHST